MTRASTSRAKRRAALTELPDGWQEPYSPYHELAFVVQEKGRTVSWWSVPELTGDDGPTYAAGWAIGRQFAADLIQVLRECVDHTDTDGLRAVVEDMFGRELTNVERGFFTALSEYLASGAITMTLNMDAAFTSTPKPYQGEGES